MKEMNFEAGELDAMFRYMDFDCNGSISFNEFLEVVKGPMNKRRVKMVLKAFKVGSGGACSSWEGVGVQHLPAMSLEKNSRVADKK